MSTMDRFLYFQLQDKYEELGNAHVKKMEELAQLQAQNEELRNLVNEAMELMPSGHDSDCIFYNLRCEDCKCGIDEWKNKASKQGKE